MGMSPMQVRFRAGGGGRKNDVIRFGWYQDTADVGQPRLFASWAEALAARLGGHSFVLPEDGHWAVDAMYSWELVDVAVDYGGGYWWIDKGTWPHLESHVTPGSRPNYHDGLPDWWVELG